nr:MAG TPA: hypothetical protein [Caudoviricetes sp.]
MSPHICVITFGSCCIFVIRFVTPTLLSLECRTISYTSLYPLVSTSLEAYSTLFSHISMLPFR